VLPEQYEFLLEKMGLSEAERKLTENMPKAVAYGYLTARRKANGGRRERPGFGSTSLSDLFGGLQ
jgi:hypothetical protein